MQQPPQWGPGYGPANQQHGYPQAQGQGYGPPPPRPPQKSNTGLIVGIVVGVVCLMAIPGIISGTKKPSTAATTSSISQPEPERPAKAAAPAPKPAAPPLEVEAKKLFDDYQENEVAADDRYTGKKLLVRGTVQSIDKDFLGNIIVRLQTSNPFMGAMATMEDSEKSKASGLAKGKRVAVVCVGRGIVIGTPSLGDCTFAN